MVLETLQQMETKFTDIENSQREIDVKVFELSNKLDSFEMSARKFDDVSEDVRKQRKECERLSAQLRGVCNH